MTYKKRVPYTYLVVEKTTGKAYYGVRFAEDCDPSDLGKTYFTSCKRLKANFRNNPEEYYFEVRKVFSTPKEAQRWEHKVLRRLDVVNNPKWINSANGGPCDGQRGGRIKGVPFSEEHKANMKGSKSPEHIAKLRMSAEKARAANHTPEARKRRSERMKGNPAPNKGQRKYNGLLNKKFLESTIHIPAGTVAKSVGVSTNVIFTYRKEQLGYTTSDTPKIAWNKGLNGDEYPFRNPKYSCIKCKRVLSNSVYPRHHC